MWQRPVIVISVLAVTIGACTTARSTPATAPPTSAARTTSTASTTTTKAPDTTTSEATTTTVDRVGEITAIFEDLERRRLEAIAAGDREAFIDLFADTPYLDESLAVFDLVEPGPVPVIEAQVIEVSRDEDSCLVIVARLIVDGQQGRLSSTVLVPGRTGWVFAYAYEGSEGWQCDGPHPLSP